MKIRIMALAALLAGGLFTACSNGGDPAVLPGGDNGETKSVYLKISSDRSKADVPSASGTTAALYSAIVYFLDGSADPQIHSVLTVGDGGDITIAELEEGYMVEDVSSIVTQVYVVGNYNSSNSDGNYPNFPTEIGQRLSAVQAVTLNIEQVSYPQYGDTPTSQLMTVMDGQANLVKYSSDPLGWGGVETPGTEDYYAVVSISPVVARIEIVEIDYTGTSSFTLEGIYINNYFQSLPLSLAIGNNSPMNNGSEVNYYDVDNAAFAYSAYSTLYDLIGEDAAGATEFTPDNGTWAYQVFGGSTPVPHIVLKLTDVESAGGTSIGDRYVTITGYQNGGSDVTVFERNTIYKINNLTFSDDDFAPVPEPETINVWVRVTVEPWVTVNVTPTI